MCLLCLCAQLFVCALWSPAGKVLTSWLSFVVSNCEFVTFSLVSWVRCGTWLYRFLNFAPLLTFIWLFPMMPSFQIAQMVSLHQTVGLPELQKRFFKMTSPEPLVQIQNNFTELFLLIPSTKLAQMVLLRWTKGPPEPQKRNIFKRHLLRNHLSKFKIISQNCSSEYPLENCTNGSTPLNKGAARAPDKKYLLTTSPKPLVQTSYNYTWMFPITPSFKIAQMVSLHGTGGLPELQIRNILNDIFSWTTGANSN